MVKLDFAQFVVCSQQWLSFVGVFLGGVEMEKVDV